MLTNVDTSCIAEHLQTSSEPKTVARRRNTATLSSDEAPPPTGPKKPDIQPGPGRGQAQTGVVCKIFFGPTGFPDALYGDLRHSDV